MGQAVHSARGLARGEWGEPLAADTLGLGDVEQVRQPKAPQDAYELKLLGGLLVANEQARWTHAARMAMPRSPFGLAAKALLGPVAGTRVATTS